MSRRFSQPDSLEMLLDTMCNTFGGIILIALLISLVARDPRINEAIVRPGPKSVELTQRRQTQAETELAQARALQSTLARQASDPNLTNTIRLIEQRLALRQQVEQLATTNQQTSQQLSARTSAGQTNAVEKLRAQRQERDTLSRQRLEERNQAQVLEDKTRELAAQLQTVENRLAELTAAQRRTLRLPREHQTGKRPWDIIVRYGRLYPVHFQRNGQKERNTVSLAWRAAPDGGEFAEPKSGEGIDPQASSPALTSLLNEVPTNKFYFVFQVYEDSFAAFNQARPVVTQKGFEVSWVPLENTKRLKAATGGEAPPPL